MKSRLPPIHIPDNLTTTDFIFNAARKHANKVALIDGPTGKSYTYNDIITRTKKLASALSRHGFQQGDVLCTYIHNSVEYVIVVLAMGLVGGTITACNPMYTPGELGRQLTDAQVTYVLAMPGNVATVEAAKTQYHLQLKDIVVLGDCPGYLSYEDLLQRGDVNDAPHANVEVKEDVFMLGYSSGTTGVPKGKIWTHHDTVANVLQLCDPSWELDIYPGRDVYVAVLPMYHGFILMTCVLVGFHYGNRIVVYPGYRPDTFLQGIVKYKVTVLHLVPPIVLHLAKLPMVDKYDISHVHTIFSAAAQLSAETAKEVNRRCKIKHVRQLFGMTEIGMVLGCRASSWKYGSLGELGPNMEAKVICQKTGEELGPNKEGELLIRGDNISKGYWNRPEVNAAVYRKDGFVHTGDLVYYDTDGQFFYTERLKDIMKFSGFQVSPTELEDILLTHPAVADAAVIGVPFGDKGQAPKAFVVAKPNMQVTETEIFDFVAGKVVPYKKLRGGIQFVQEIPKSAAGKILKRVLMDQEKDKLKANI